MSQTFNGKRRKNPYDTFKIDSRKILRNKSQFRQPGQSNKRIITKKLFLTKILNRTKSVLKSKSDFSEYMKEYDSIVTKSTFKNPDIHNYPLLRKSCSDMISLKNQNKTQDNVVKKKILNNFFNNRIMSSSIKEKLRANLSINTSAKIHKNRKLEEWLMKKKERDKLFIYEDFFYKWKEKDENNKEGNNYSELYYDENKIFYNDYSDFIKERLNYCKKNKLENLQKKLKIVFEDRKKKKIKLELISMKIIFEPIKNEKFKFDNKENDEYNFEDYKEINTTNTTNQYNNSFEEDFNYNDDFTNKKNIITFPLSYVFLFYINGLDYFKNILIGSIKFSNDFKNVFFEENEIYSIIRNNKKFNKNFKDFNFRKLNTKAIKTNIIKSGTSKMPGGQNNNKQFLSLKSFNNLAKREKEKEKKLSENFNTEENDKVNILYKTIKTIKKMHSNQDLRKKQLKKKDTIYSEYCFLWETPNKSYKVRIIMPLIIFWSEHIEKNIITFCDKELFLFLLKNNFVNWDYYILYYLFSLKIFRLIILKGISYFSKYNIKNNTINRLYMQQYLNDINERTSIININRKIYNQDSDKNESFKFFYTDNFSINSIIDFNSFHIFIESDKLNNKIVYEFCLNFKQMFYLLNISRYENLYSFLPKIIQTNFEERTLNLDFTVLEYFNNKILGKLFTPKQFRNQIERKNSTSNKNNRAKSSYDKKYEWDNMIINIKMPFIIVEQFVRSDLLNNNMKKVELNLNFLNILKNCGNNLWSKKILQLLDLKSNNHQINNSNLNLMKVKSKDERNFEENKRYDELLTNYNKVKKHSKSLHFKVRKSNI